jgi:quercetin dioxygenase-like cupin family protein
MRRVLFPVLAVVMAMGSVVLGADVASATPGSGITRTELARATVNPFHVDSPDVKMFVKNRADIVTQEVTIAAGGSTGWHIHFGTAFVLVKSGTFALTRADGCETNVYHAGEGFVEAPTDVHIGRNVGSVPVDIIATYTNVPIGGSVARSVDAPAGCA